MACYAECAVTATDALDAYVGGIVGTNSNNATVIHCHYSGAVKAIGTYTVDAGGCVGQNVNMSGEVSYCYATGTVSATGEPDRTYSGGIVGFNFTGSVSNCVALTTSVDGATANRIAVMENGSISDCYALSGMRIGNIPVSGVHADDVTGKDFDDTTGWSDAFGDGVFGATKDSHADDQQWADDADDYSITHTPRLWWE
jgi:hypothetical protein